MNAVSSTVPPSSIILHFTIGANQKDTVVRACIPFFGDSLGAASGQPCVQKRGARSVGAFTQNYCFGEQCSLDQLMGDQSQQRTIRLRSHLFETKIGQKHMRETDGK